jgi:hypothetical protein
MSTYHFVAASEAFLCEEEPLEEVLRERVRHYGEQGKEIDFWLVRRPAFLRLPNWPRPLRPGLIPAVVGHPEIGAARRQTRDRSGSPVIRTARGIFVGGLPPPPPGQWPERPADSGACGRRS